MCEKCYECDSSISNRKIIVECQKYPKKLIMKCTNFHIQSDLMNIGVRQNMNLFMTVTSNHCINKIIVGISLIIVHIHLFVFCRIMLDR